MKYVILGPRKAITRILDEENDRTTAISNAKAQLAQEIKNDGDIPFLIDNQVTSRKLEREKGNMMRWNEETESWNITPVPVPVPRKITSWQARAALKLTSHGDGKLFDAVEAALNALPEGDQKIVILTAWQNNANFERNSPTITSLAEAIGLTKEQVDGLFILGDSLDV
jgi:hypothetical protein